MARTRVFSAPIEAAEGSDVNLYVKITDTQSSGTDSWDSEVPMYDTGSSECPFEYKLTVTATDGATVYRADSEISRAQVQLSSQKGQLPAAAAELWQDADRFSSMVYKVLLYGAHDEKIGLRVQERDAYLDLQFVQPGDDFVFKLFSLPLSPDDSLQVDLYEWFDIMNSQNSSLIRLLTLQLEQNKRKDERMAQLVKDNEQVMKNYDIIRNSTDKFAAVLNEKKRKIAELTAGTGIIDLEMLNQRRAQVDEFDVLHRSSFDLGNVKFEEKHTDLKPARKRRRVKTELKEETPQPIPQEDENSTQSTEYSTEADDDDNGL